MRLLKRLAAQFRAFRWGLQLREPIHILALALIPILVLYAYSMLWRPYLDGGGEWQHIHAVWENWQTFNAAMIALLASLVAIQVARIADRRATRRRFVAASANLPQAISDLLTFFRECSNFFIACRQLSMAQPTVQETPAVPTAPASVFPVLSACIEHADDSTGEALASVARDVQVIRARMANAHDLVTGNVGNRAEVFEMYLAGLAGTTSVSLDLFDVARGESEIFVRSSESEAFSNAVSSLRLPEDVRQRMNAYRSVIARTGRSRSN